MAMRAIKNLKINPGRPGHDLEPRHEIKGFWPNEGVLPQKSAPAAGQGVLVTVKTGGAAVTLILR